GSRAAARRAARHTCGPAANRRRSAPPRECEPAPPSFSSAAGVVAACIGNRLELPAVGVAEEDALRDPVVALLPVDPRVVQAALQLFALVRRHADRDVVARASGLMERKPRVADVGHYGMVLRLDDSGAEDALVERGR